LFYITSDQTFIDFAKPFGATIVALCLMDALTLLPKRIKRLTIANNCLTFGKDIISVESILSITPKKDKRRGIDIKTIEIEYLIDGRTKRQRTITKPTFFDLFGKKFKIINILVDQFPNLQDKVMDETED
jgi:hypothetical protein